MGYTYLRDFPKPSRARIAAIKIQADLELEKSRQDFRDLSELEAGIRNYILRVFLAFAKESLELGWQGLWTVECIDKEAREFLGCITLEAQLQKGHDQRGRSINPLTDHVFGHILPEVRQEFEKSSAWLHYQEGLLAVAQVQGLDRVTQSPTSRRAQAAASDREEYGKPAAHGKRQNSPPPPTPAQKWEEVEISFLSDEQIQIRIAGGPETYNYAEFGCSDRRTGRPNKIPTKRLDTHPRTERFRESTASLGANDLQLAPALVVHPVAAMDPDDGCLIAIGLGIHAGSTERLGWRGD